MDNKLRVLVSYFGPQLDVIFGATARDNYTGRGTSGE